MPERLSLDLRRLRAAYRSGAETPVTVAGSVLERIGRSEGDGVWIGRRPAAAVLRDAEALLGRADREALPLYGVPFAVKDNIDVAGLPTTAACPAFAYHAERSAPVVERLVAAGALLVGKTNMDQFAAGLVGTRSPYGTARNPFNALMPPGGSSSGSAVAVAAGLVSFALGTDTAGSGRVPASFNGIVGLKPTRGSLSTRGVVPACRSLDCVSVFALTVEDAAAVAAVAAGFDAEDPYSRAAPAGFDPRPLAWRGRWRVGVLAGEDRAFFGDRQAAALYDAAVARAEAAGGEPVVVDFAPFREAASLLYGAWTAERAAAVEGLLRDDPGALHPVTRAVLEAGLGAGAIDLFRAQHRLQALAAAVRPTWRAVDALLLPTTGTAFSLAAIEADPIGRNSDLGVYTNFVNLLDLAAIAIPNGYAEYAPGPRFPAGITLVGPAWHDGLLATLARLLEGAAGLPLGATGHGLPEGAGDSPGRPAAYPLLEVAVFGAHLSGQPLNPALVALGGVLRRACRTAPVFRMKRVAGAVERPALVHVGPEGGVAIEGEVWTLPSEAAGAFLAGILPPLGLGTIPLEDGQAVTGFICDASVAADAEDLSGFGGWRAYRDAQPVRGLGARAFRAG